MTVKYENIVPWGRNFKEYTKMFNLTKADLYKKIIGCGDGPASFNFEGKEMGYNIVSVDPIYNFSKEIIVQRIEETYRIVIEQTALNKEKFLWREFKNIDELGKTRIDTMKIFLNDYTKGKEEKRYIEGELPNLKFNDKSFDLALSSHFLFLYSDNLTFDFHIKAMEEMLRIAKEIRIFPITENNGEISRYYLKTVEYFKNNNYDVELQVIEYEFQKGGNKMLKICSAD